MRRTWISWLIMLLTGTTISMIEKQNESIGVSIKSADAERVIGGTTDQG